MSLRHELLDGTKSEESDHEWGLVKQFGLLFKLSRKDTSVKMSWL